MIKDGLKVELVKFNELEEKIGKMLAEHKALRKQNQDLEELLKNKGWELEEAKKRIEGLAEERDAIRTKVDSLLDLLQNIGVSE
ncbi:MAG: hypothetical protein PHY31_02940 [Smithellaceae bacterium]|nr:hypothetical protein [Smithellaceae bacterium]